MSTRNRIVIAGGTGFIGQGVAEALSKRDVDLVILTRDPHNYAGPGRAVLWDAHTLGEWIGEIDGADSVINLAGKNVNCRYTQKNLREVDQSRVRAVMLMGEAIRRAKNPPRILIQASTTAIYGDAGESICDESTPPGLGIPPETATMWENAFNASPTQHTRRVHLRISFALGATGGALQTLAQMTRCFMGGTVGSGRQFLSWIHIDDLVRLILRAIDDDAINGLYVAATPNAVTNAEFMRELRRVLHRPWSPPTPAWLVRLGCVILRTEPVLALTGRRAMPRRLMEMRFVFQHPDLPEALEAIFGGKNAMQPVPSTA
jgi:uncharacterized protein (TIGR01777 family)